MQGHLCATNPTCQKASYRDSPVTAKMPKPPIHTSANVRYSNDSTLLKLQRQDKPQAQTHTLCTL